MIYTVIETRVKAGESKPEKVTTNFENDNVLIAKADAEAFYIEKFFESGMSPELRFKIKSERGFYFLSSDYLMEGAKAEAARIEQLTGNKYIPVTWEDRQAKLISAYKKINEGIIKAPTEPRAIANPTVITKPEPVIKLEVRETVSAEINTLPVEELDIVIRLKEFTKSIEAAGKLSPRKKLEGIKILIDG